MATWPTATSPTEDVRRPPGRRQPDMTTPNDKPVPDTRRRGIRRTAWAVGIVAVGIYAAFLLSVMLP